MSKKQFWIRFGTYILFLLIVPLIFMVIRFKLFQKITTFSIGGWGVITIVAAAIGFIKLIKEVKKGLPFCYFTQVLNGLVKIVIPSLMFTIIVYMLKDSIDELIQVMCVFIPCQLIAILVNPIPQWSYDNHLEEKGRNLKIILQTAGLTKQNEENKN